MCRRNVETHPFEQIDVQGWLGAFTHQDRILATVSIVSQIAPAPSTAGHSLSIDDAVHFKMTKARTEKAGGF